MEKVIQLETEVIKKKNNLLRSLIPVMGLVLLIVLGVIVMPQMLATYTEVTDVYGQTTTVKEQGPSMPLELVFLFASLISIINLLLMGYKWEEIQESIVKKVSQLIPAAMILLAIGLVIGSWMFSGTIPMLVYYGVEIINPNYMYIVAFIVPSIFSMLTGTSWGSAGTIGVVVMGIATAVGANLAITAAAIVGGAYFGDKMSPLSDTTNIAALAANVPLMDHIRSMLNTTGPAYLLAGIAYFIIGLIAPTQTSQAQSNDIILLQDGLSQLFNFDNAFLIIVLSIPVMIVLFGSIKKFPTVPILVASSVVAAVIGVLVQGLSFNNMLAALNSGFSTADIYSGTEVSESVAAILNRGGLYSMVGPVIISILVFIFIGTLERINAIPYLVDKAFKFVKTRPQTILSSMLATAVTIGLTSNQFATSFIISEGFNSKFDQLKIPRKVLSRSLEDFGTMLENLLPWTTTGIFMFATLGVSPLSYGMYNFLSLFGFVIAVILAITGIGCFYNEKNINVKGN